MSDEEVETYNPWTVVNLVFSHLAEQGLHPVLGESGDPGPPAQGAARGARHRALTPKATARSGATCTRNLAEIRAVDVRRTAKPDR